MRRAPLRENVVSPSIGPTATHLRPIRPVRGPLSNPQTIGKVISTLHRLSTHLPAHKSARRSA